MGRGRASSRKAATDGLTTGSGKAASKQDPVEKLFNSYSSNSSGTNIIEPEGIESLCSDLGVDHTDVRILMLAWKMQAKKQGYFSLDEWRRGLKALKVSTIPKLKTSLLDLEKEVREPSNFADFYYYAFRYCLTEEHQKTVAIEYICLLLDLVLGSQYRPQVDALIQYLKIQEDYKVITMDQWRGFYSFCQEVDFLNLDSYDPDQEAWPSFVDDFVDWLRSTRG